MRIKNELKKSGYFWPSGEPKKKVPGTLAVTEGGKIQLELIGAFDEVVEGIAKLLSGENAPKRIIGHIEEYGSVSLEDCFYTEGPYISLSGGISKSTIRAHMALIGGAYERDKIFVNTFIFSVEGIDEWVGLTEVKVEHQIEKQTARIEYSPPKEISLNLNNGMKLLITASLSWIFPDFANLKETKTTHKTYFKLISEEERILKDFISTAYKITTFLGFAIDQPVCIEEVYVTSETIRNEVGNGETRPISMSLYYESLFYTKTEPEINRDQMLFRFGHIQKDAQRIFNKWLDSYNEISPALNLYSAARTGAYQFLDGKFLALIRGLETYHSRTSHKKHLKLAERVKELIELFENFIGTTEEQENLKTTIVATRNYLTHYDTRLKPKAADGKDLLLLYMKMEAIFQLHLLNMLGFTTEEINSIYHNNHRLREKLDKKTP